jgi:hypothetical protein
MSNVLANRSDYTITLRQNAPITVKNQIKEIRAIDDIPKVNTALKVDGAALIYNATTGYYDVKPFSAAVQNVATISITTLLANNGAGLNGQVLHTNGNTIYWANTNTFIGTIDCGSY